MPHHLRLALAAAALALLAACENPVRPTEGHLEAVDVRLVTTAGDTLAATVENRMWTGAPLRVARGDTLAFRAVFVDFGGRTFTVAREGFSVRVEAESGGVVQWEPTDAHDRLIGLAPGTTRLRVMIWHVTHPDFIAPPLEVTVAR